MLALARALYRKVKLQLDKRAVLRQVQHIHGPKSFASDSTEYFVVSLVKDVEAYIDEFIKHYTKLGAKGIVLLDNGSTDATIARAQQYANVSIFRCSLPFLEYEARMRRYFIEHKFKNQWVMCVDADEHFDYPHSGTYSMGDFLGYLNSSGYTAVSACMLDVYAKDETPSASFGGDFRERYSYFDLHTIAPKPYPTDWYHTRGNRVPSALRIYSGGVRGRIMPEASDCLLTKHPLMFIDGRVIPFSHPHYCAGANIADVVCVLLHYKFIEGFGARAEAILATGATGRKWTAENAAYVNFLRKGKGTFFHDNSISYTSVEALVAAEVLPSPRALEVYLAQNQPEKAGKTPAETLDSVEERRSSAAISVVANPRQ